MRVHLLRLAAAAAAIAIPAAPATAQAYDSSPRAGTYSGGLDTPGAFRGGEGWRDGGRDHRDRRGRHWRHRDRGDYSFVYYGGEWARWNNHSFEPESYNDWWHERPNRSLPRWTQNNRDCRQQYWTSAGWTC